MEDIVRVVELKRIKGRVFHSGLRFCGREGYARSVESITQHRTMTNCSVSTGQIQILLAIAYTLNELYYFLNDGPEFRKPEKPPYEE